jgi:RNA polymerase sigma-54 factor
MSLIPAKTTLADYLLQQAQLDLPAHRLPVATYLVHNLDERGFLCCDTEDVADRFGVSCDEVEQVVAVLQGLDPPGIAARDPRECLLIQLRQLRHQGVDHALAERLISDHWQALGRRALAEIAETAGVTSGEIHAALQFISNNLNPFPAQAFWLEPQDVPSQEKTQVLHPNVIIRACDESGSRDYVIEIPEEQMHQVRISPMYAEEMEALRRNGLHADQEWAEWEALYARARLFIRGLRQRWRTLRRIVRHLIDYQRDYLSHGDRSLRPLTRAQLADLLGVHESTVSRAVADKYVQLPDGKIVPLAKFFDSTASTKSAIKDLIAREECPLSDREIAEQLAREGYDISRRTVAKYRNALGIPPSTVRGRIRELRMASRRRNGAVDGRGGASSDTE